VTFSKVLAPVLPFITEQLHQGLVVAHDPDAPESVHLTAWPEADTAAIDEDLEAAMATVREVVRLGHGLRKQHGIRVRQPLATLTVLTADPAVRAAVEGHVGLIGEELNVQTVEVSADEAALVDLTCKPNFKALGPRLGPAVKTVAAGLAELDGGTITDILHGATVEVAGHEIGADDIMVSREPRDGVVVAAGRDLSVALDTGVDDALAAEGIARELVAALQRLRRDAGLDVTERIAVVWHSDDATVRAAIDRHGDMIAGEVLATSVEERAEGEPVDLVGHPVLLGIGRA